MARNTSGPIVRMSGMNVPKSKKEKTLHVRFARPGVPGTQEAVLKASTLPTIQHAIDAAGVTLNTDKEGIVVKGSRREADGTIKNFNDGCEDGVTYFITPGISSQ